MQFSKKTFFDFIKKPTVLVFILLFFFTIDRYSRWVDFNKSNFPFEYDVDQYYSFLPAAFIHHDLTFSFPNNYWTNKLPNGNNVPRGTIGMSIMYSPFFFIGHGIAKLGNYKVDGYSLPYKWSIHIGSILYSLLGLWFCRKSLLKYFSELITAITLICIFLGTNLFYYTYGYGEMPHSYLFFIFSLFIVYVLKWLESLRLKHLLIFSFLAGFATLIRPTECLVLLFPLLVEVKSIKNFKERLKLFFSYSYRIAFAILLFVMPFFMQMLYWKIYAGQWFFFSYGEKEGFFFSDPQIINFLFSFRKGWLIYTPIMVFSILGIFMLRRKLPGFLLFNVIYLTLVIYILSSWWDWPFGGSFGCRALIHHYAFLAFSFAVFVSVVFDFLKDRLIWNYAIKTITCLVFAALIILNYNQSWKYKYGIIHYNGMTKEAYFYVFNKNQLSTEEFIEFNKKLKPLDYNAMLKGNRNQ